MAIVNGLRGARQGVMPMDDAGLVRARWWFLARVGAAIFTIEFVQMLLFWYAGVMFDHWVATVVDSLTVVVVVPLVINLLRHQVFNLVGSQEPRREVGLGSGKLPPLPLIGLVLLEVIFATESAIMLILEEDANTVNPLVTALSDAGLLVGALLPMIHVVTRRYFLAPRAQAAPGWWYSTVGGVFGVIFIPALTTLIILGVVLAQSENRTHRSLELVANRHHLELIEEELAGEIRTWGHETMLLARNREFAGLLRGDERAVQELERLFQDVLEVKRNIYSLRFLDTEGNERLRADMVAGEPRLIPRNRLQSKAGRYYFRESSKLKPGEVFISPLDLAVERNRLVEPYQPVIRFVTPVFAAAGERIGVVVVSVSGEVVSGVLRKFDSESHLELHLVDGSGYWLYSGDPDSLWGFALPERARRNFATRYPRYWQQIVANRSGTIEWGTELVAFATVTPQEYLKDELAAGGPSRTERTSQIWKLIITTRVVAGSPVGSLRNLSFMFLFLGVVTGVSCFGLASIFIRNRKANLAYNESQELVNLLLDSTGEGIVGLDREGLVIFSNQAAARQLKYEMVGELLGLSICTVCRHQHPKPELRANCLLLRSCREGSTIRSENEVFWTRERAPLPVEYAIRPVYRDGELFGAVLSFADISHRLRAAQTIKENQRFLETLIGNLPGVVYRCKHDPLRTMTYISRGCEELIGYPVSDLINNHDMAFGSLILPEDRSAVVKGIEEGLERRQPYELTYRIATASGYEKWVWERGVGIWTDAGSLTGLEGFITDVTARKQAEARLAEYTDQLEEMVKERTKQLVHAERLASLGTFSAGMAHEINNPNSFISGNVQFLQLFWGVAQPILERHAADDPSGRVTSHLGEVRDTLSGILDGSQRISKIVDSLKAYSKGGMEADRVECRMVDPVNDAANLLRHRIKKGTDLVLEVPPELMVICDRQQMGQVFVNFFTNSLDAMDGAGMERERRIEVTARQVERHIWVWVKDNGPGIPEEAAGRIFDPFYTTKGKTKGTGLGLSIVHGIITDHRGQVTVMSQPGLGAEFLIILPSCELFREQMRSKSATGGVSDRRVVDEVS